MDKSITTRRQCNPAVAQDTLFTIAPSTHEQRGVPGEMIAAVWAHYQQRHQSAQLDAKRRSLIRDRLLDGYTPADLCVAIDGCHGDAWYMGENNRGKAYCDLSLILRDADHVDKFIRLAREPRLPTTADGAVLTRMAGGSQETMTASARLIVHARG